MEIKLKEHIDRLKKEDVSLTAQHMFAIAYMAGFTDLLTQVITPLKEIKLEEFDVYLKEIMKEN